MTMRYNVNAIKKEYAMIKRSLGRVNMPVYDALEYSESISNDDSGIQKDISKMPVDSGILLYNCYVRRIITSKRIELSLSDFKPNIVIDIESENLSNIKTSVSELDYDDKVAVIVQPSFLQRAVKSKEKILVPCMDIYAYEDISRIDIARDSKRMGHIVDLSILSQIEEEPDIKMIKSLIDWESGENVESSKKGCYVATYVYGSYDCPQVWVLRRFRDHYLAKTVWGSFFVGFYYYVSPKMIRIFGNNNVFRSIWKVILDSFVSILEKKGISSTFYMD